MVNNFNILINADKRVDIHINYGKTVKLRNLTQIIEIL